MWIKTLPGSVSFASDAPRSLKAMEVLDVQMAIHVYRQLGDAGMVMGLERIAYVEDKNLLAGHVALLFGNYQTAQASLGEPSRGLASPGPSHDSPRVQRVTVPHPWSRVQDDGFEPCVKFFASPHWMSVYPMPMTSRASPGSMFRRVFANEEDERDGVHRSEWWWFGGAPTRTVPG